MKKNISRIAILCFAILQIVVFTSSAAPVSFQDGIPEWAAADINALYEQGILRGRSDSEFASSEYVTIAEIATMLYRLSGEPAYDVTNTFIPQDVEKGAWYYDAAAWSISNELTPIIPSPPTLEYRPNDWVWRGDAVVLIYQYLEYRGITLDLSYSSALSEFEDADDIILVTYSDETPDICALAIHDGVLRGKSPNTIDAVGPTTRAEFAVLLNRALTRYQNELNATNP